MRGLMEDTALAARYHRAFNDRDFDVWRELHAPVENAPKRALLMAALIAAAPDIIAPIKIFFIKFAPSRAGPLR